MLTKKILKPGDGAAAKPGDKLFCHFVAKRKDGTVVDDSRKLRHEPFELLTGKKFVFTAMEDALLSMSSGEKAVFSLSPEEAMPYTQLATALRREAPSDDHEHGHGHGHGHSHAGGSCCAATLLSGENQDLYLLNGEPLELELELLSINQAGSYGKEAWEMTAGERLNDAKKLKESGNAHFKQKQYRQAMSCFERCLAHVEFLESHAKRPGNGMTDDDVQAGHDLYVPALLNLAACELKEALYPECISHTSQVLERDADNVKAYFRRAQAHFERGRDLELALSDVQSAQRLSPDDKPIKILHQKIAKTQVSAKADQSSMYQKMFK